MERPEGALAVLLGISQLVYLVAMATLGVRLLLRARRTRELPEGLLSLHFLLCCSLGYLLLVVAFSAAQAPGSLPVALVAWLVALGHLVSAVGVWAAAAFNQQVFRRGVAWARGLLALAALTMAAGYVGYGLAGGFAHARMEGAWHWLLYGTYVGVAAWVAAEPLHYWGAMRRRARLGLADPLESNRFLLWGAGSVCRFAMLILGALPSLVFGSLPGQLSPVVLSATLICVALAGLGVAVAYWLTFFPSPAFARLVTRSGSPSR